MNYKLAFELEGKKHLIGDCEAQTRSGSIFAGAEIKYIKNDNAINIKDKVAILLNDDVLFTGFAHFVACLVGKITVGLVEGTEEFHTKKIMSDFSFRKEKAKNILNEILDIAKIEDKNIDFADEEIERFSLYNVTIEHALLTLKEVIKLYTNEEIMIFFDRENKFNFIEKSKFKQKEVFEFNYGENIISLDKYLKVEPKNIRSDEKIKIDGEEKRITQTILTIRDGNGVMNIYY